MSNQVYRNTTDIYAEDNKDLVNFTSRAWVQLAGQLEPSGAGLFQANTQIIGTNLLRNTWYKVKTGVTTAPELVGQMNAQYTLQVAGDWTFDPVIGNLTCNKAGNYTIVYNMTLHRTAGAGTATWFCAIGGNDNPPNQSFAGGGGAATTDYIALAGTCIDTVANNGDTRALWIRYQGSNATESMELGALNLVFDPVIEF